jgi:hypothetical protein
MANIFNRFLTPLSVNYKQEGWSQLEINILALILKCALHLGHSEVYLSHALDLLKHNTLLSLQERQNLTGTILQVIEVFAI